VKFLPDLTQNLAAPIAVKPLQAIGWGIVTVAGVVTAGISLWIVTFLVLAVLGWLIPPLILPILAIAFLTWFTLFIGFGIVAGFLPPILLSWLGGRWLIDKFQPQRRLGTLGTLLVGLVAFVLLTAIPVFGDIFNAIAVFLGLGAIWLWWRNKGSRIAMTSEVPLAALEI
jgi:hypothetical protein